MIVVDGRTDEEKLRELLAAGAEETCLDFKATLDLSERTTKQSLDFVKDCVAMGNLPRGGYIAVGVGDDGRPAHHQQAVDPRQFDSADLRARVAKYVEAPVSMISQRHDVDGRVVVLVYVEPNSDGLPVPFATTGQYNLGDGKMKTVFTEGTFVIREGTSNVAFRFSHWNEVLGRYRDRVREESRADVDELLNKVVTALRDTTQPVADALPGAAAGTGVAPLVLGMSWDSFEEALLTHLESSSTPRIQRFLESTLDAVVTTIPGREPATGPPVDSPPETTPSSAASQSKFTYEKALDAIAVVAINASRYQRSDIYDLAIDSLRAAYDGRGRTPTLNVGDPGSDRVSTRHWLEVVQRVMAIGRFVVAASRWPMLPVLVDRRVPVLPDYAYESWIRHAHVAGSRNGLLGAAVGTEHAGGALLSWTRQAIAERPQLRPDVSTPSPFAHGDIQPDDQLLDALAQFDLWWCVMAQTRASGRPGRAFYPSCAALHQHRCQPAIDTIATDNAARDAAFLEVPLETVARSLATVVATAERESWNYGGWWGGLAEGTPAHAFVAENAPDAFDGRGYPAARGFGR
ncbi:MAG: ATP-binding protein [Actinomycetota bacterium]|nr:ATP-binding protein [Actinomycetota bacterium]